MIYDASCDDVVMYIERVTILSAGNACCFMHEAGCLD